MSLDVKEDRISERLWTSFSDVSGERKSMVYLPVYEYFQLAYLKFSFGFVKRCFYLSGVLVKRCFPKHDQRYPYFYEKLKRYAKTL